jgi:hypothetical protein
LHFRQRLGARSSLQELYICRINELAFTS